MTDEQWARIEEIAKGPKGDIQTLKAEWALELKRQMLFNANQVIKTDKLRNDRQLELKGL